MGAIPCRLFVFLAPAYICTVAHTLRADSWIGLTDGNGRVSPAGASDCAGSDALHWKPAIIESELKGLAHAKSHRICTIGRASYIARQCPGDMASGRGDRVRDAMHW